MMHKINHCSDIKISVITATFNAVSTLPALADSLFAQTSKSFEWIVVDGLSTDGTYEYLKNLSESNSWIKLIHEPDFGIYDALNKGIKNAAYDHYIVIGSDDKFSPTAIQDYTDALFRTPTADVILSKVIKDGRVCGGFKRKARWLGHQQVFKGSHSIGMLFRKTLHDQHGFYSNRFPMLADGFFLKKLLNDHNVFFLEQNFVSGTFSTGGLSGTGKLQSLAETWQIQMLTEEKRTVQTILFFLKVLARLRRIIN